MNELNIRTRDYSSLLVQYEYTPGSLGSMYDSFGDPGDPPEGCEIEIVHAWFPDRDGEDIVALLDEGEVVEIEDRIIDYELDVEYGEDEELDKDCAPFDDDDDLDSDCDEFEMRDAECEEEEE